MVVIASSVNLSEQCAINVRINLCSVSVMSNGINGISLNLKY